MEIQKAEEFWQSLNETVKKPLTSGTTWTEPIDGAESIRRIQARDKAWLDLYKKAVIECGCHEETFNSGDIDRILYALDSVLCGIEEGK